MVTRVPHLNPPAPNSPLLVYIIQYVREEMCQSMKTATTSMLGSLQSRMRRTEGGGRGGGVSVCIMHGLLHGP